MIADELAEAEAKAKDSGKPERLFKELRYQTLNSWSRERRVVAKAEHLPKGKNPRFIVTSLTPEKLKAQELYETIYCARGEMACSRMLTGEAKGCIDFQPPKQGRP